MYQELETMNDLKRRIEDLFVCQRRKLTQLEIVTIFKRSGVDRVYQALDEMVKGNKLVASNSDPISPPSYELAIDVS